MKNQKRIKKTKKHNPRSEAAQREAIKRLAEPGVDLKWLAGGEDYEIYAIQALGGTQNEVIAIFDLRDCYRKRKPLTGITKTMRKVIQPRRKK